MAVGSTTAKTSPDPWTTRPKWPSRAGDNNSDSDKLVPLAYVRSDIDSDGLSFAFVPANFPSAKVPSVVIAIVAVVKAIVLVDLIIVNQCGRSARLGSYLRC